MRTVARLFLAAVGMYCLGTAFALIAGIIPVGVAIIALLMGIIAILIYLFYRS